MINSALQTDFLSRVLKYKLHLQTVFVKGVWLENPFLINNIHEVLEYTILFKINHDH